MKANDIYDCGLSGHIWPYYEEPIADLLTRSFSNYLRNVIVAVVLRVLKSCPACCPSWIVVIFHWLKNVLSFVLMWRVVWLFDNLFCPNFFTSVIRRGIVVIRRFARAVDRIFEYWISISLLIAPTLLRLVCAPMWNTLLIVYAQVHFSKISYSVRFRPFMWFVEYPLWSGDFPIGESCKLACFYKSIHSNSINNVIFQSSAVLTTPIK